MRECGCWRLKQINDTRHYWLKIRSCDVCSESEENNSGCSRAPVVKSSSRVSVAVKKVCVQVTYWTSCALHCLWYSFLFSFFHVWVLRKSVWWQWRVVRCEKNVAYEPFWVRGGGQMVTFFVFMENAYKTCSQLTACFLWAMASHYASVGGCVSVDWDLTTSSDLANGLHVNCICRTRLPRSRRTLPGSVFCCPVAQALQTGHVLTATTSSVGALPVLSLESASFFFFTSL